MDNYATVTTNFYGVFYRLRFQMLILNKLTH